MKGRILVSVLIAGLMLAISISPGLALVPPHEEAHRGPGATQDGEVAAVTPVDGHGGKGRFVENLGQWGDHVRFVATGAMGEVAFHDDGAMYILKEDGADRAVKVSFHGATNVIPVGVGDTGARHNYLIGDDPDGWVVGAREFEAMEYQNVWEGIDVRYYFTDLGFKYDVVVGQDADPSSVRFDVDGHTGLEVGIDQMTISVGEGTLLDRDLVAWYEGGEAVEASFRPTGDGYGFSVDKTPGRTLIIDPLVITRSTFLGGTYEDLGADLTMDDEGNVYVAGSSVSTDYPVTPGVHNETNQGDDLVITKMDRDLSTIIWSTYIGGTSKELMTSIALDEEGNVHALGTTESDDFPVTPGALQNARGGPYRSDLFILKLSSDGSSLVYATYMGGMSIEIPGDIEVHDGRAYVAASTESKDFPIGDISGWRYSSAPFVLIISEDGTKLEAFQYWNVTRMVEPFSMHVGEDGTVTLTGRTSSPDLPTTPGAYVEEAIWPMASFVIQCDPWTNETSLCTYFGATGVYASEVALDAEGNIYLAGLAYSFNQGLPLTEGAWCSTFKGTRDEFLAKMDPNGSRVEYCTLVGGDNYDFAGDLDVTDDGNAIFVGWSWKAENLNTTGNAHDDENEGAYEGFVVVLDKEGSSPVQSTYLGDQFGDYITSVYVTPEGTLLLSGYTESKKFPVTEGAYQEELAGDRDIFITELAVLSPPSAPLNLTAKGGEGHITLGWEPPIDVNGFDIINYTIKRQNGDGEETVKYVVGAVTSFIDEQVEYGEYYTYRVSAFNGKGMSLPSNSATARSVTVPDAPANLTGRVNDDHIKLEWKAPAFTGGLALGEYNLYRAMEGGELELISTVHPFLEAFVDPNVADRLTYTYVLSATNEYGESRDNPSLTLRMTGIPTPPRSLDYTYGDRYIELFWEEPEDDFDLPVVRYHVYRMGGNSPPALVGVVTAPSLVMRDRTVDVGETYRYHVIAENAKGMSDPSNEVEAMTMVAPDPPREVEAVANELFIRITWSPPDFDGASPLTSYRIYLSDHENGDLLLGDVTVAGVEEPRLVFLHEQEWDGLPRDYYVTALNVEGESDPSQAIWTQSFQVPTPPHSLSVQGGDGTVSLTWAYPEDDGGAPVYSYGVFRRMVGSPTFIEVATLPASNLRFVDDTAVNGVEYSYWITAINLAGMSEPSAEVTVMPAGPPSAPSRVEAEGLNGSVRISWQTPDWTGGMPLLGYRVYGISEGSQAELLEELGPGETESIQGSLTNGEVYLYAVLAFTSVGESEMSQVVEGRPVGAPSAPQALIAVWMDGMVYVTWSSPMHDGGLPVEGYKLFREDWKGTDWTEVQPLEMMFSDEEVEHNGTYTYRVYAFNAVGPSPVVNITITVPPKEESVEDEPAEMWPWLVLAAAGAVLILAIALRGRTRHPPGTREVTVSEPTTEDHLVTEEDDVMAEEEVVEVDEDPGTDAPDDAEDEDGPQVTEEDEEVQVDVEG